MWRGYIDGSVDDFVTYSSIRKLKAKNNYKCVFTGTTINKGTEYFYLTCYNPHRRKSFKFRFSLDVPREIKNYYRKNPEEASEHLSYKNSLGFFNEAQSNPIRDQLIETILREEHMEDLRRELYRVIGIPGQYFNF